MTFEPAPVKPAITYADFERLDIRAGTIVEVCDVPQSKKLVALTVSFGDHRRTILAGIKQERENPREIEGRQALFVVNLAPRKMAGMVSEGMLFDLGYEDGVSPVLACPEAPVPDGTRAA
jgi:tRNA-binding protein